MPGIVSTGAQKAAARAAIPEVLGRFHAGASTVSGSPGVEAVLRNSHRDIHQGDNVVAALSDGWLNHGTPQNGLKVLWEDPNHSWRTISFGAGLGDNGDDAERVKSLMLDGARPLTVTDVPKGVRLIYGFNAAIPVHNGTGTRVMLPLNPGPSGGEARNGLFKVAREAGIPLP